MTNKLSVLRESEINVDDHFLRWSGKPFPVDLLKIQTPFYFYNGDFLLKRALSLRRAMQPLGVTICYAVKANPNPHIMKVLAKVGIGFDVVSGGELDLAIKVRQKRNLPIVFSGVGKQLYELESAINTGVASIHVETIGEIELIISLKPTRPISLLLRVNPDVDAKTHPYISTGLKSNKFGLGPNEIRECVRLISLNRKHLVLRGISIHIGSQITDLKPLAEAYSRAESMLEDIKMLWGSELDSLDLGGGLGVSYHDEPVHGASDWANLISCSIPKSIEKRRNIYIEPGRWLVAPAGILVTSVLYRKEREEKTFLVCDAAMNDLMRPSLYESYHHIIPLEQKAASSRIEVADVVGPVCETGDFLARERGLPRMVVGDRLAIATVGAYGSSMSSFYNLRPLIPELLWMKDQLYQIRARVNFTDQWRYFRKVPL